MNISPVSNSYSKAYAYSVPKKFDVKNQPSQLAFKGGSNTMFFVGVMSALSIISLNYIDRTHKESLEKAGQILKTEFKDSQVKSTAIEDTNGDKSPELIFTDGKKKITIDIHNRTVTRCNEQGDCFESKL